MATDSLGITGSATVTIATALFIMALPAILCGIFIVALVWVEWHQKYLAHAASLVFVLTAGAATKLSPSVFLGLPYLWRWFLGGRS